MKKIVKFLDFNKLNEGLGEDNIEKFKNFSNIKSYLLDYIEESVNSNDMKLINDFIDSFISDQESTNIEGLINDSDIYEFYLKFINEIDEVLNDTEYFTKTPEALGLYDILIDGTKKAVYELVKQIKDDLND